MFQLFFELSKLQSLKNVPVELKEKDTACDKISHLVSSVISPYVVGMVAGCRQELYKLEEHSLKGHRAKKSCVDKKFISVKSQNTKSS